MEKQIRETVTGAPSAIDGVVANVQDTIGNRAGSAQRTFGVPYQIHRHPWASFAGAVALGYWIGGRNGRLRLAGENRFDSGPDRYRGELRHGLANGVVGQFIGEIGSLRSALVGAIVTVLWEVVKDSLSTQGEHSRKESP
ncbi:MAG TPA: hypothetical protein VMT22_18470 [Terriglobales bacterium]|jgi:hypothetical protein|nr:hypothetical protein [Terriglobales bacterium]